MSKLFVANFKMNGTKAFIETYFENIVIPKNNTVIICPPYPFLSFSNDLITEISCNNIHLGAQNCHHKESGAFTGEVSANMLVDVGCKYVIIGHSERRQHHHEDDSQVQEKAKAAIEQGLIPIICVGETLQQREQGIANDVVLTQLQQSTPPDGKFMIAYEPIWAIGTGLTPSLTDIQEIQNVIRKNYANTDTHILYGGSVTLENASIILSLPNVDGVLVGGASLNVEDFNKIIAL